MKVPVAWVLLFLMLGLDQGSSRRVDSSLNGILTRQKREGFFSELEEPLQTMRRSFQGLTRNMSRSMKSFMSAISTGMRTLQSEFQHRSPRLIRPAPAPVPVSVPAPVTAPLHSLPPPVQHLPLSQAPSRPSSPLIFPQQIPVISNHVQPDCNCTDHAPFQPVVVQEPLGIGHHHGIVGSGSESPSSVVQPFVPSPVSLYAPEPLYTDVQYSTTAAPLYNEVQFSTTPPSSSPVYTETQYSTPSSSSSAPFNDLQYSTTSSPSTTTTARITVQQTTELYEVPSHLSDEEICEHLKSLKEDIHSAPVGHAGDGHGVDIHKLETIGVHTLHQKSSAVVPDQQHPEKYISIDCNNIKKVVNQRLYYIDTKPLVLKLKGHNKVRETVEKEHEN